MHRKYQLQYFKPPQFRNIDVNVTLLVNSFFGKSVGSR